MAKHKYNISQIYINMITYAELPPYTNRNLLSPKSLQEWSEQIQILKKNLIEPIIKQPKKITFNQKDYTPLSTVFHEINKDFLKLVYYFLLCMKELSKKKHARARLFVSLLYGQQDYLEDDILNNLIDGVQYGHLKRLEEIYFEFKGSNDEYYLNMMKILCMPYADVMRGTILMCKDLFMKSESCDFESLMKEENNSDYLQGMI